MIVGRARRLGPIGGEDRLAARIANAQLKFPILGPVHGLLVLADFEQDQIPARFQLAASDVLIHRAVGVIHLGRRKQRAVEPDLVGSFRSQPQFDGPRLVALELGHGVRHHAHVLADRLVQVDHAVFIAGVVRVPTNLAALHRIRSGHVNRRLRRIGHVEALALMIIEGTQQLPIEQEPVMVGQVDRMPQLLERLGHQLDLVQIAGRVQCLAIGRECQIGVLRGRRFFRGQQDASHGVAAQLQAGVIEHLRDQPVHGGRIVAGDPFIG